MQTLIINGSPRKQGDSMTIVNEMIRYIEGEIKVINVYYDHITPCVDCRYCWNHKGCCINDDMQEVYQLIDQVDNIIISSPLYFSELTGQLLNFASRLQTFYVRKYIKKDTEFKLKKKKGVLVLVGGGSGSPNPAIARANIIFKEMNTDVIGTILSLQTDTVPSVQDASALQKAKELALQLNTQ